MATTVTQGNAQNLDIAIGEKYIVTTTGEAVVDLVSGMLGAGDQQHRIVGTSRAFGPYGAPARVRVRAIVDAAECKRAYDDAAVIAVRDEDGNVSLADKNGFKFPPSKGSTPSDPNLSIVVLGGDHTYLQHYGTNGRNGMLQMYLDAGIEPYIAACADLSPADDRTSGVGATIGASPDMLTMTQALALQAKGAEFVSHGARHPDCWDLVNTGLRIWYKGASTGATVFPDATGVTLAHSGGTVTVLYSAAPTISQLVTAIEANANWRCVPATELTGNEPSSALLPLAAARSVAASTDPQSNNQRFALSGGIRLMYSGLAYRDMYANVNGNFLSIFADGLRIASLDIRTYTLSTLCAAINAACVAWTPAIADLVAVVMDNGYRAQTPIAEFPGQTIRESYVYGDEKATALWRLDYTSIGFEGIAVEAGLGFTYTIHRLTAAVKERYEPYGLKINNFCQAGGRFFPWVMRANSHKHNTWRGNRSFPRSNGLISPQAVPAAMLDDFTPFFTAAGPTSESPFSEDDIKAIWDAVATSDGAWYVDQLCHLLTPTPADPSGYVVNVQTPGLYANSADQDEGPMSRELQYLGSLIKAGKIEAAAPEKARAIRASKRMPANRIFNSHLKSRRATLLGITTLKQGTGGIAVPGWVVTSAVADYSGYEVVNGVLQATINGTTGSGGRTPIATNIFLEPGETFTIGAQLDMRDMTAGSAAWALYPLHGQFSGYPALNVVNELPHYALTFPENDFTFTVPANQGPTAARIVSKQGPFDLSTNNKIQLKLDGVVVGSGVTFADITLTGATPTAVTAKEIAAAINAAIAGTANFALKEEYHNCARAEGGKVVIECPRAVGPAGSNALTEVSAGSVTSALVTIFAAAARAVPNSSARHTTSTVGYRLALIIASGSAGQIRMSNPFCRKVRY